MMKVPITPMYLVHIGVSVATAVAVVGAVGNGGSRYIGVAL